MNKDINHLYKRLLIATIVCMIVFVGGSCAFMYFVHPTSPIMATEAAVGMQDTNGAGKTDIASNTGTNASKNAAPVGNTGDIKTLSPSTESPVGASAGELKLGVSASDSDYIWIPVEPGVSSSDIVLENHYMDRQLWVAIYSGNPEYYEENTVTGNLSRIISAEAVDDDNRLILKFMMDRVYEYDTIFENGVLYIKPQFPKEAYDRIVVIDPAGYVPDEMKVENSMTPAAICLDIARRLASQLEEMGIRVYMTSVDERVASDKDSLTLASNVKPDMYIRIETAYNEDSLVYGTSTVYNGNYFIPGFGSVELADLMEAYVTTSIGGKAEGLVPATENDGVINGSTVPAAAIRVGYYTNAQENVLLNREDYRTKIADGLKEAVMEAYGE